MQPLCLIISHLFLLSWMPWVGGSIIIQHRLKVEDFEDSGDETALNGIRLYCVNPNNRRGRYATVESEMGRWGKWTHVTWCNTGFLDSFKLRVEPQQFFLFGDNTAVNNIKFRCSGSRAELEGDGMAWGSWGSWSDKCPNGYICGLKTRVEAPQGIGDDTALNDVQFLCCIYPTPTYLNLRGSFINR
ncbi:vitelline membrane outer layer protein 1 homolog isoform X1 [Channa argus]|uniref:vitelline membrane outer layer protein 1 homolog isoform X1 n=1 Tax=Channa argus TaxID=215402 RepID=UPI00352102A6